jgi:hypothetical protein
MTKLRYGLLAVLFAVGCGAAEENVPAGTDENALADQDPGKADFAGGWWVQNEGGIGCFETKSGKTGSVGGFDGYTFKQVKGGKIGFDVVTSRRARVLVYGPMKNARWGGVRLSDWTQWNGNAKTYTTTIKWTAPEEGKYFVVVGAYVLGATTYALTYYCDSEPHCVEYVSTDDTHTSLRSFYAINVNSYQEGKDTLAALNGNFVDEAINPGTCAEQSQICTKIYKPVCAADITPDAGPEPQQHGNLCAFKVAVRNASLGSPWNGAKGHWDEGECKPAFCTPGDKKYVGTPATCPLIRYTCDFDQGYSHFQDAQGCGCECKDLHWYWTCGTPVCMPDSQDPAYLAIPVCTTQVDGERCAVEGDYCRPAVYDCGKLIKCQTERPLICPRSQRDKKRDIQYLDDAGLQKQAKDLLAVKLASYQYKDAPVTSQRRLGFIIEDGAPSFTVDDKREKVDLYGYASMAVATLKVQQKQIDALKAEVEALKAQLARRASR